jgi:uncharacterized protein (DUF1697 family)
MTGPDRALRCGSFIRGINVGTTKRISMSDLCAIFEQAGGSDVRTIGASGNVVFSSHEACDVVRDRVAEQLRQRFGEAVMLVVLSAAELAEVVAGNPYAGREGADKYAMVGLLSDIATGRSALAELEGSDWGVEELRIGERAVYLWYPDGTTSSRLPPFVARALGPSVTVRNWATVCKVARLLGIEFPSA